MATKNYAAIQQADTFGKFVDRLIADNKPFGFDIESGYTGEDKVGVSLLPFHPEWVMVGFSFTNDLTWARYVPVNHDDADVNVDDKVATARHLWRLLQTGLGVAHNSDFELTGLSRWFRDVLWDDPEVGEQVRDSMGLYPLRSDTMLEVYLLALYDPIRIGKGLKPLTKHIFKHEMTNFWDLFSSDTTTKRKKYIRFNTRGLTTQVLEYACEDSLWCLALHLKHYDDVKDTFIFKVEMALTPVLVNMSINGLSLDWDLIERRISDVNRLALEYQEEILAEFSKRLGRTVDINLASVKQLSEILYNQLGLKIHEYTDAGAPSTGESALRGLAQQDPVVKKILQYREILKLNSSYLQKYWNELRYTDKVHAGHKQTGALTGRMSVEHLPYQQFPKPYKYKTKKGFEFSFNFRDIVVSPEHFRIVGYDFSQVELRVLAGMSNETTMLEAFASGVDIHKATASAMMGIPIEEVTKKQRGVGKTLNFAVVYGSGASNIASMLSTPSEPVTKQMAQGYLDTYFSTFSKLKAWMDARVVEGHEQGYVETHFKRKFKVWEYESPLPYIRSKGDRMCVNAPVQGGAADYMKIGMVRIQKKIRDAGLQNKILMVMTIHDALEFYVHESVDTQTVIDLVGPQASFPVEGFPEIRADWHEGKRFGSVAELRMDENNKIIGYGWEGYDNTEGEFDSLEDFYRYIDLRDEGYTPEDAYDVAKGIKGLADVSPRSTTVEAVSEATSTVDIDLDDTEEPQQVGWILTLNSMPSRKQWEDFKVYLKAKVGSQEMTLSTPQGVITLDTRVDLEEEDQPILSLLFSGATLAPKMEIRQEVSA